MKKRLTSLVMSVLLAASLAGCAGTEISSKPEDVTTAPRSETVTETQTETTADTLLPITLPPAESEESGTDSVPEEDTAPKEYTPLMWQLTTDDGVTLTMLGSMHALTEDCYPLPTVITEAYEKADLFVNECDAATATQNFALQIEEIRNMYYDGGDTIDAHIGTELYEQLVEFGKEFGLDLTLYRSCKPWVWSAMIENMIVVESGMKGQYGVDIWLTNKAHEDGKEMFELESAEYQARLLMNLSDDKQILQLKLFAAMTKESAIETYLNSVEEWKKGDEYDAAKTVYTDLIIKEAEKQGRTVSEEEAAVWTEYNKEMVFDRNLGMRDKIIELLKSGKKNIFLTVGSAHFVGDQGIIALLEAEGYKITKISPAPDEEQPADESSEEEKAA
ncbi:MAG: TraB/GumN family protein [Ruminococcus sp.]|nr:TraB/GumN family protein [Ruminococcus sp.]